jgi:hypothetical protein
MLSKHIADFRNRFLGLIGPARFNPRLGQLQNLVVNQTNLLSMTLGEKVGVLTVDSLACPVAKNCRDSSFTISKGDALKAPREVNSTVDIKYFMACERYPHASEHGLFQSIQLTPLNAHDINFPGHA